MSTAKGSERVDVTAARVVRTLRWDGTYQAARQRVNRNDAFDEVVAAAVPLVLGAVAEEVERFLLTLRAAVARAEYGDDRADLQALWDTLNSLGGER